MAAVASRYARAFVDVVFSSKLDTTQVLQDLHSIQALMQESTELKMVWENPSIEPEQKRGLLDAIIARLGIQRRVRNFMAVLIDHHRMAMLTEITKQVEREIHEQLGFAEAEVTSARELGENERRDLELQIMNITGKRALATYTVDPQLLGGATIRIGSTIYDGSVRGQLQKMKEQLASG
jgi:F-type H+-transporting ATPase subunit delta